MAYLMRLRKGDIRVLAEEMGVSVTEGDTIMMLKKKIIESENYEEECIKELANTIVAERLERERLEREKSEKEERLEREKSEKEERENAEKLRLAHELEKEKLRIQESTNQTYDARELSSETSLEKLIKSVKTLSIKVPEGTEGWNLFFNSLERAFQTKNVPDNQQAEILLNILGDKAEKLLIYITREQIESYQQLKELVLREHEPTPKACLENFRKSRRNQNETHVLFVSRLQATWENYCRIRGADTYEKVNQLIITDKLVNSLDEETAAHIGLTQQNNWLVASKIAKECDTFFDAKHKSYTITHKAFKGRERHINSDEYNARKDNKFNASGRRNGNNDVKSFSGRRTEFKKFREDTSPKCFKCGLNGHYQRFCTKGSNGGNNQASKWRESKAAINKVCINENQQIPEGAIVARILAKNESKNNVIGEALNKLEKIEVSVNGQKATGLIDSGCEISVVHKNLVPEEALKGTACIYLQGLFGEPVKSPLIKLPLAIPQFGQTNVIHQEVLCAVTDNIKEQVILHPEIINELVGVNEEGYGLEEKGTDNLNTNADKDKNDELNSVGDKGNVYTVETKVKNLQDNSKEKAVIKKDSNGKVKESNTDIDSNDKVKESNTDIFKQAQRNCKDLKKSWELARNNKGGFYIVNDLLYHKDKLVGETVAQIVVPKLRREEILKLAHTSVYGGHHGTKKTIQRIRYSFYWEGMAKETKEFCESCLECQLTRVVKVNDRVPISPVSRPELPFQVVNVDLIGPIEPKSSQGHQYILCLIDQHTRWAEAIPLKNLTAKTTCDALLQIFMRTGIPNIIACDNATNFNADLTKEFEKRLGASPRFSTPQYPQSNGLVERFNQTLKRMLHHTIREEGKHWHEQIPFVLWAYREVPNSTTGVAPFQLLYGRAPEGPLSVLKSSWSGEHKGAQLDTIPIHDYLIKLRERLERAANEAKLSSEVQQGKMAHYYNLRSKEKTFEVGDKVVLLIPDSTNKLYSRWQGPATIVEKRNQHSFIVELADGSRKHVHQNKIRSFVARSNVVNIVFDSDEEFGEIGETPLLDRKQQIEKEIEKIELKGLSDNQVQDIKSILKENKEVFMGPVRPAKVGEHRIDLKPGVIRKKPKLYSVPIAYKDEVERQVRELLDLNLIEVSNAEISHPIVCVAKKDATIRLCIDYRALNSVTQVPTFPMKDSQEIMYTAGAAKYLSSIDLLRGYWQIKMADDCKNLTAFTTHNGTYQWRTMPFGLSGAAATFQKEMNIALQKHHKYAQAYIDDVIIFSNSWEEHCEHVRAVIEELRSRNFTIRLDKCKFGEKLTKFLGHVIGGGTHAPDQEKIGAIKDLKRPRTKKEVRSVLGLMGFYRTYIPNYAEIAIPLTELTKGKVKNIVPWDQRADKAFNTLKNELCKVTRLSTPSVGLEYQLHADASDLAVGCCLTQKDEKGQFKPIAFASQKLTGAQRAWPSIEKEAWSVLFGLRKFEKWTYGSRIEVITDHNPLKFLSETTPRSPKLTRWALALQRWDLTISHRPGKQHLNADAISRLSRESWEEPTITTDTASNKQQVINSKSI